MRYLQSRGQQKQEQVLVFELSPELVDLVQNKGMPLFAWW